MSNLPDAIAISLTDHVTRDAAPTPITGGTTPIIACGAGPPGTNSASNGVVLLWTGLPDPTTVASLDSATTPGRDRRRHRPDRWRRHRRRRELRGPDRRLLGGVRTRCTRLLAALAAAATALLVGAPSPATATPPADDDGVVPYGSTSLFQTPLPSTAPVSPDQAFFASWIQANEPKDYWTMRVTRDQFSMNFAVGRCSDPLYKIVSTGSTQKGQDHLKTVGVHIPTAMLSAIVQNTDVPVIVQDRCGTSARPGGMSVLMANVLYDGTTTLKSGGDGIITGGAFDHRTNGLDSRVPGTNAAARVNTVSRGRIPDATFVRDALLTKVASGQLAHPAAVPGTLGHVLQTFFVQSNTAAGFQKPMAGAESAKLGCGGSEHLGLCAQGQYIRIDPSIDLAARPGCTDHALTVARTLQSYGAYIGDNSGSGSGIKGEAGTTLLTQASLDPCMDLADLRILTKGYAPR